MVVHKTAVAQVTKTAVADTTLTEVAETAVTEVAEIEPLTASSPSNPPTGAKKSSGK